jgi:hypothetical protein
MNLAGDPLITRARTLAMEITKIAPLGPFRIYRRKPLDIWLWVCCSMWSFSPIGNHLTRVLGAAVCRSGSTTYIGHPHSIAPPVKFPKQSRKIQRLHSLSFADP